MTINRLPQELDVLKGKSRQLRRFAQDFSDSVCKTQTSGCSTEALSQPAEERSLATTVVVASEREAIQSDKHAERLLLNCRVAALLATTG